MSTLKKEYLQTELNLSINVIENFFKDWKIIPDEKISKTVKLLNCYGFHTVMSCEGHVPPYDKVDTFRLFWPYVQVELVHNTLFHLEEREPRMETISGNTMRNFSKLNQLISEFNCMNHPFSKGRLEMSVILVEEIDTLLTPIGFNEALQNHWGIKSLVCDSGVQGILTMPQEFLSDDFRERFLKRTQEQMDLFTKFLEWRYINPYYNEEK